MLIFIHHKNSNKDFRKILTQPTFDIAACKSQHNLFHSNSDTECDAAKLTECVCGFVHQKKLFLSWLLGWQLLQGDIIDGTLLLLSTTIKNQISLLLRKRETTSSMEVTYLAFANSSVKRLVKWEATTHSKKGNPQLTAIMYQRMYDWKKFTLFIMGSGRPN